jgi:hypothetical protein
MSFMNVSYIMNNAKCMYIYSYLYIYMYTYYMKICIYTYIYTCIQCILLIIQNVYFSYKQAVFKVPPAKSSTPNLNNQP